MIAARYVCLLLGAWVCLAQTAEQVEFFEKKIRPVLAGSCQGCHNAKLKSAELDMSTAAGFRAGGQSGPLVDTAKPEESRLLKVVSYDERLKMPPTGKLSAAQLADLGAWVKMGAPWPNAGEASAAATGWSVRKGGRNFSEEEKKFWSFQALKPVTPPAVRDESWVRTPVDRFILAKLEQQDLKPAAPAAKATLLRRVTFDLTGLPPTEQEIRDFLADSSSGAYRAVVERLLASPRYGERWGRHWLDVARYADSTGNDEDHRYPYAWRYRDYVIEAFNSDMPYDQFVREQIAGDLMPAASGGVNRRGIIATGFLALGAKAIAQQDKQKMLYDVYDEQLDVVSKSFLGLTLSCARCHDHKFDPLLQRDYYSLVNFFANTKSFKEAQTHVSKLLYVPLAPREEYKKYLAHQDAVGQKKLEIEDLGEQEKERFSAGLTPRLADYMVAARQVNLTRRPSAEVAAEKGLKPEILAKWAKYLEFDWRQKPHLEDWSKADDATAAQVAGQYQQRYQQQLQKWTRRLGRWRENARRMLKEMNMPPPPKPEFKAEEDGFFYDIYVDGKGPFGLTVKDQERVFSPQARETLARLKQQLAGLQQSGPPEPDMACSVEEADQPLAQKVFIRGDYNSLGEDAPKAFPLILRRAQDPAAGDQGSGRRALADWLASPGNPLTPRVMANRIWQRHFVEGIVRTPDNFGKMGERPTHPELLDWLAGEFVARGWSVKQMHRTILLSNAYQMDSAPSADALKKDRENRLFSRFHRRRLDVEEIRDGLLAMDGSLDVTVGGTLQKGFGTDGENSQDRLSVNPETLTRRSVYLPLRRANLPTLFNLFDFGDATTTQGRRAATNVAPQALFMLNSDFVTRTSATAAKQILEDASLNPRSRMEAAYLRTLNRKPVPEEVDAGLSYVAGYQRKFPGNAGDQEAWQSLCRVLMASNDFIYVD